MSPPKVLRIPSRRERAVLLAVLVAVAAAPGCGRGRAVEESRKEREAYARTVERIHENLLRVMVRRAPDLVPPLAAEDIGSQGSIRDLHEMFEASFESMQGNIRDLDREIAELEQIIQKRRAAPMPYEAPEEAYLRKWSLYYEITRVRKLEWRR